MLISFDSIPSNGIIEHIITVLFDFDDIDIGMNVHPSYLTKSSLLMHFLIVLLRYIIIEMAKLNLKHFQGKMNYVQTLIHKGICEAKEIRNYTDHKLSPQLTQDVMQFIESEISNGKFSKVDLDNKSGIVSEILKQSFGLTDDEISNIDSQITYILDNNLIQKTSFLKATFSVLKSLVVSSSNPTN